MNKLAQLREHRHHTSRQANSLNDRFPAGTRMPASESEQLDTLLAEIEAIDQDIARENRLLQLAADQPAAQQHSLLHAATRDPAHQSEESLALRSYLRGGLRALGEADRQRMAARQSPELRNALSTENAPEGGYTVATEYVRALEVAMKSFGGMREVATVLPMASGAQMNFPTTDPTLEMGEIVGQNQLTSESDTRFGNLTLEVFKYSSKSIPVPFELLQDSFIDIETYLNGLLAMRIGRITNLHFTLGSGKGEPHGIVTAAALGKSVALSKNNSIAYDDLVDLEHSVDPAYRRQAGAGFMMADATLKQLRKIKDGQGRPIFVPGYESGSPGGAPDTLLGRPFTLNQDMAEAAPGTRPLLFGLMSKYMIRDVMDFTLFRFTDSAYTLRGQVGFVGFMRCGGNLIDAGGAVKCLDMAAS